MTESHALAQAGVDTPKLVESICAAFAYQMHVDGSFSGDPHPGNILVQPKDDGAAEGDARVVLLDWGLAKVLDSNMRLAFARMVFGASSSGSFQEDARPSTTGRKHYCWLVDVSSPWIGTLTLFATAAAYSGQVVVASAGEGKQCRSEARQASQAKAR